MSISRRDEDLLTWFFEEGVGLFWRSPLGPALERQGALGFDSRGRRVGKPQPWTRAATSAHRHRPVEASYLPDDDELFRAAAVSRRLRRVGAVDRAAEQTLETYYGGLGARWARTSFGRIFALYPLTDAGATLVREEQSARPDLELLPHEHIAAQWRAQRMQPTQSRRERCALIHAEAERRLFSAWRAWRAADDARPRRPS